MAKTAVSDWSTTPASNTDIGGIDIGEGTMLPSAVNNAIRELMAQIKTGGFSSGAYTPGGTDVAIADGGTGAGTALAGFDALKQAATTTYSGVVEIATSAEWRTGTDTARGLGVSQTWGAAAEVTLTDAATIAVDMSTFINAKVTLGGNRTLGQPSNTKVGQSGFIRIIQDATGSRTLAFHADWKFANGQDPIVSTTAAATDILFYTVVATNVIVASLARAVA